MCGMRKEDLMDDQVFGGHHAAHEGQGEASWRDLREWLRLVESHDGLKKIAAPVETDEELGAITYLASRQEPAPALLFENLVGDTTRSRILSNMLGSSRERYAL